MNVPKPTRDNITGVILAGGRARRMGGVDKGLVEIAGKPMAEWVLKALSPQVEEVLINANRSADRYQALALNVRIVPDEMTNFQGPLAGMASAMAAAKTPWIVTVPCDSPFVPTDLVKRFCDAMSDGPPDDAPCVVTASDGQRLQPVFNLIPVTLRADIVNFLATGERKIDLWFKRHHHRVADIKDQPNTFLNINTEEDRQQFESMLVRMTRAAASP